MQKKTEQLAQIPEMKYYVENEAKGDRVSQFLEIFASILKHSNYRMALEHYIKVSAKCGRCTSSCHVYKTTGDLKDIPCYRSELLLSIYRRYFSLEGSMFSRLFGGFELTEEHIDKMAYSFWNCTACRKCVLECPSGIDHGLLTHLARYIMAEMNLAPRALVISTREQLHGKTANTSGIPFIALKDSLEFLEEELLEITGQEIRFPIDLENAEYILFTPVSDFLMEADTLMGIAAVLHSAGISWTIGSKYYDAINYGLFYSDLVLARALRKMEEETRRLKAKKILIGECGHATRSASFLKTYWRGDDCPEMLNIMELTHDLLKEGRIKLDPSKISEKITYHDPCNIARQGWIVEQPREIIRALSNNFVEMTPNKTENYCCGGGGGTVSIDEIRKYRTLVSGKVKAEQIKKTGAHYVVAPCANCKKQFRELMEDNKVDGELVGLHDLILKAIVF
ncbi:MAG: (Fe-S)-binding protein [Ignavibacteria bacterium]|nr:(Fe-S)-binding protein [Ignavibacteria bacterium]